jgi:hypothetical protein
MPDKLTEEIQEVIMAWHRTRAGYFILNQVVDDTTLAQAISDYIKGKIPKESMSQKYLLSLEGMKNNIEADGIIKGYNQAITDTKQNLGVE